MAVRVPITVFIILSATILFSVHIESCTPPTAEELESDGWSKFNNRWYKIFPKLCDADEAEQSCEVLGAHLISIHSKPEDTFVTGSFIYRPHRIVSYSCSGMKIDFVYHKSLTKETVGDKVNSLTNGTKRAGVGGTPARYLKTELFNKYNSSQKDALWIGLRRIKRNSNLWKYTDGTKVDYFNWYETQPDNKDGDEDCAQIYTPYHYEENPRQWGDHKCQESFRVGCKL